MKFKHALIVLVIAIIFSGCSAKKEPVTAETFNDVMVNKGYAVLELTGSQAPEGALNAILAMRGSHKVEYYRLNSSAQTVEGFNNIQAAFEKSKLSSDQIVLKKTNRFSFMSVTSADSFSVISRISDTLLLTTSTLEDKEAVLEIYNELGYGMD
jgi:hypothetical protein